MLILLKVVIFFKATGYDNVGATYLRATGVQKIGTEYILTGNSSDILEIPDLILQQIPSTLNAFSTLKLVKAPSFSNSRVCCVIIIMSLLLQGMKQEMSQLPPLSLVL